MGSQKKKSIQFSIANKEGFIMMKEQVIIFDVPEGKKHSVCYKTRQDSPAVTSIYVMRSHLGLTVPKKLKVVISEVE
jgi:hypothetical protein